jgi:lysophosphatidylglycerol acyltransferase 1
VELREHIKHTYIPRNRKWIVLFPEGGFLRKRLEASQRYAMKNNLPHLKNVTLPRIGAVKTVIEALSSGFGEKTLSTPPQSIKCLNHIIDSMPKNNLYSEFQIDNERQQTPKQYNNGCNLNKKIVSGLLNGKLGNAIIEEVENKKDELDEIEIIPSKSLKYVLDITIAYESGKPLELMDIVTALKTPTSTHLLYRLYRFSEVREEDIIFSKSQGFELVIFFDQYL